MQERLFGAYVDTIHDARTNPMSLNGAPEEGFYGTVEVTTARVAAEFSDGSPAVTVAQTGLGTAILLNFDSGLLCEKPGNIAVEDFVGAEYSSGAYVLEEISLPVTAPIVFCVPERSAVWK